MFQSIWSPLKNPAFRGLWLGGVVFFIGSGMQAMAASWLIVEISGSSFIAALVQTAVFLPMFLLALPAGVLSDTSDRKKLISVSLLIHAGSGLLLSVLVLAGVRSWESVLLLVFLGGCCTAVLTPAWNSSVVERIHRSEWPNAITAISIAYNAARAVGPTIAGLIFAGLGAGWAFISAVIGALMMWRSIRRWPPLAHAPSRLPPERLWSGMLSGLRFARHSDVVFAQLLRVMAFSATGSALWALLPVIAQRQLGTGAQGFGFLMGCLGAGAVTSGLFIGQIRARFGLDKVIAFCCVAFALVMFACAWIPNRTVVYFAMLLGGAAWLAAMSTFNSATQASSPPWVRSRAIALHMMASLGAFAFGSALWGAIASFGGLSAALTLAALIMLCGPALSIPFPLRIGAKQEITQTASWEVLMLSIEPDPESGPVAVEVSYKITPESEGEFLDTIIRMKNVRRRDGATIWRVYRDLGDPTRFVERFIVSSWAQCLHQRSRETFADKVLESQIGTYLAENEHAHMSHYIAER